MAKGQKRPTKEPKKSKSEVKSDKKEAGPKYLRDSGGGTMQAGVLATAGGAKKR